MKKPNLKFYGVRLDEALVALLEARGLTLSDALRLGLETMAKAKRCPTCGQIVKK